MATAAVTFTFAPNTLIQSAQANTDFADLVSFLNGSVIHKDGTVAATAHLSGPATDPSSGSQYANKTYVDRLGIVAQQTLTTNTATWSTGGDTDMLLNNVSVVAGRSYEIRLRTQYRLDSLNVAAAWNIDLTLNGSVLERLCRLQPGVSGTSQGTMDVGVWWVPSVTAATDDFLVTAVEEVDGMTLSFQAAANNKRRLTVVDYGVL